MKILIINIIWILEIFFILLCLSSDNFIKVKKYVNEMLNGKGDKNLETFATDFNLQPHQILTIQDRLIFERKVIPKRDRTIEY